MADSTDFIDTGCAGWPCYRGAYIEFGPIPKDGKRTWTWKVFSRDKRDYLGDVKWFGHWRGYAFFPHPDCVFEQTCLREIADFIEVRTDEHRRGVKL